jgi:hypothetical protein
MFYGAPSSGSLTSIHEETNLPEAYTYPVLSGLAKLHTASHTSPYNTILYSQGWPNCILQATHPLTIPSCTLRAGQIAYCKPHIPLQYHPVLSGLAKLHSASHTSPYNTILYSQGWPNCILQATHPLTILHM